MDAAVMCSGYATRMKDVGEVVPKTLLPIDGRPVLDHILEGLERSEDVKRVAVTSNRKFTSDIKFFLGMKRGAGYKKELVIVVEPSVNNDDRLGTIGSIINVIKEAKIKEDLLVVFGDNFYSFGMDEIARGFKRMGGMGMVVYEVDSLETAKRFGVVRLDGNRVVEIEEKPEKPRSRLVSTGIYFFPKKMLGIFEKYVKQTGNKDAMGSFLKWALERGKKLYAIRREGEWNDIGHLDAYKQLVEEHRRLGAVGRSEV